MSPGIQENRIISVNSRQPGTDIHRYNIFLNGLDNVTQINIIDDVTKLHISQFRIDFLGRLQGGWLNALFPGYSCDDFIKGLKKNVDRNTVLQYTSHRDEPFTVDNQTLVTVRNNHFSHYKTAMYSNGKADILQKLHHRSGRNIFEHYTMKSPYATTNTEYVKRSLREYGYRGQIETINHSLSPIFRKLDAGKKDLRMALCLTFVMILFLRVFNNGLRKNLYLTQKLSEIIGNEYRIVRVGDGIRNSINFKNIDDERLNKLYNACVVLLFPILEEGQGLPVIEAFSTGLSVVASNIEVLKEVVDDAAIFIDPLDVHSYYNGIKEVLNCRDYLISAGKERAQKYSYQIFAKRMNDLYRRINKHG